MQNNKNLALFGKEPKTALESVLNMNLLRARSRHNALPQLGELELTLLELLWREPGSDVKALAAALPPNRRPSISTLQSTVERLHRKELLTRQKRGHAYFYTPAVKRGELMGRLIGDIIQALHDGPPETILSGFVSAAAKIDRDSLDRLRKLIDQHEQRTNRD